MARNHARLQITMWADPDWRALPGTCQWLYMLLISQPGINHAGVLDLLPKKWARLNSELDASDVAMALKTLAERRFVVVDEDTDELLVRSFIRNDGVASQPYMMKNALTAAAQVQSPVLRAVLSGELRRVDVSRMRVREGDEPVQQQYDRVLRELSDDPQGPPPAGNEPPEDTLSDSLSDRESHSLSDTPSERPCTTPCGTGPGEGVGEGVKSPLVVQDLKNTRSNPAAHPDADTAPQASKPRAKRAEPDPDGFAEFWTIYPRKVGKIAARTAYAATLKRGTTPAQLHDAARRFAHTVQGREAQYVAHPRTWLTQGRYDDEPEPATVGATPTDWTDPAAALAELRRRTDAAAAARLIGALWFEPSQPPGDPTPPGVWLRDQRIAWIDGHADQIRRAVRERREAG